MHLFAALLIQPLSRIRWRFFWRVGPRPPPGATAFMELNAEPVVPDVRPMLSAVCPSPR